MKSDGLYQRIARFCRPLAANDHTVRAVVRLTDRGQSLGACGLFLRQVGVPAVDVIFLLTCEQEFAEEVTTTLVLRCRAV